jgi:hypothetical protein
MENDFIFSSREFQNNPSNSNNVIRIGNYSNSKDAFEKMEILTNKTAKELDKELQKVSNFDDFINYQIKKTSVREVYQYFEVYKFLWDKIGRDISDYDDVFYNNITLALKDYSSSNSDKIDEIDSIVSNATSYSPYIQEDMYNDSKYSHIENLQETKENTSKEENDFKWFNPFSFNGALYIVIAGLVIYFLYKNISITYTGFLIVGALVLFGLLYFGDKINK